MLFYVHPSNQKQKHKILKELPRVQAVQARSLTRRRQTSYPREWELQRTLLATIWVRDLRAKFEVDQDVSQGA